METSSQTGAQPAVGQALVVGATGVSGSFIAAALGNARWAHRQFSRHATGPQSLRADVMDVQQLRQALDATGPFSHVFYAAVIARDTPAQTHCANVAALRNLLDALSERRAALQRIVLIEGTKWYGSHLGRYPVPAVETDRAPTPFYYHEQEDLLAEVAPREGYTWSALRPHTILGDSPRAERSFLYLLTLYAALFAQDGHRLAFPGSEERWNLPTVATDAGLLAEAALWAATSPQAAMNAFNVNNGDILHWPTVWQAICDFFGVESAGPRPTSLAATMPQLAARWEHLCTEHQIRPTPWPDARQWAFADGIFQPARIDVISTRKIVEAGFDKRVDTTTSILKALSNMAAHGRFPVRQASARAASEHLASC